MENTVPGPSGKVNVVKGYVNNWTHQFEVIDCEVKKEVKVELVEPGEAKTPSPGLQCKPKCYKCMRE